MDEVRISEKNEAAAIMNAVRRYFDGMDSAEESTESNIMKALMTYFNEGGDQS